MKEFICQQWKLIAVLTSLAIWLSFFPLWQKWITAKPLDMAISLAPRGKIEKEIEILIPENYQLILIFERADIPYDKLKSLLGDWTYRDGKPIPSGVTTPIQWSLQKKNFEIVASGKLESFGAIAWSASEVDRSVSNIKVEPGKYIFTAEILRDVPEFENIKSRISMQLHPKVSSTWQTTFAWWGSVVNLLLLWPLAIGAGLLLLWRAGLTMRSKRSLRSLGRRSAAP